MKRLFVFMLLAGFGLSATAQNGKSAGPLKGYFGVRAGANLATLTNGYEIGDLLKKPKMKLGANASIFYNLPITEHFAFQPEIGYSGEGSNQDGQIGASNTYVLVFQTKLHYINVPLLLQYRTHGFYLEAGPQIGFLVGAKEVNKHPGTGEASETDLMNSLHGNNIALDFGAGYYFGKHIGAGLRYALGLNDIRSSGSNVDKAIHNNVLSISALYRF